MAWQLFAIGEPLNDVQVNGLGQRQDPTVALSPGALQFVACSGQVAIALCPKKTRATRITIETSFILFSFVSFFCLFREYIYNQNRKKKTYDRPETDTKTQIKLFHASLSALQSGRKAEERTIETGGVSTRCLLVVRIPPFEQENFVCGITYFCEARGTQEE